MSGIEGALFFVWVFLSITVVGYNSYRLLKEQRLGKQVSIALLWNGAVGAVLVTSLLVRQFSLTFNPLLVFVIVVAAFGLVSSSLLSIGFFRRPSGWFFYSNNLVVLLLLVSQFGGQSSNTVSRAVVIYSIGSSIIFIFWLTKCVLRSYTLLGSPIKRFQYVYWLRGLAVLFLLSLFLVFSVPHSASATVVGGVTEVWSVASALFTARVVLHGPTLCLIDFSKKLVLESPRPELLEEIVSVIDMLDLPAPKGEPRSQHMRGKNGKSLELVDLHESAFAESYFPTITSTPEGWIDGLRVLSDTLEMENRFLERRCDLVREAVRETAPRVQLASKDISEQISLSRLTHGKEFLVRSSTLSRTWREAAERVRNRSSLIVIAERGAGSSALIESVLGFQTLPVIKLRSSINALAASKTEIPLSVAQREHLLSEFRKQVVRGNGAILDGLEQLSASEIREILSLTDFPDVGRPIVCTVTKRFVDESSVLTAGMFHRLRELSVELLPIRERPEDLQQLAGYFALGRYEFSNSELAELIKYSWPGNVTQLQQIISESESLPQLLSQIRMLQGEDEIGLSDPTSIKRALCFYVRLFGENLCKMAESFSLPQEILEEKIVKLGLVRTVSPTENKSL